MLDEVLDVRQIKGETQKRWFTDDYFDLIVWLDDNNGIIGFQLSYNRFKGEHALTWHRESGYNHYRVDDGENRPGKPKATPILVSDGYFDYKGIAKNFRLRSKKIEKRIARFVIEKLIRYSDSNSKRGDL